MPDYKALFQLHEAFFRATRTERNVSQVLNDYYGTVNSGRE